MITHHNCVLSLRVGLTTPKIQGNRSVRVGPTVAPLPRNPGQRAPLFGGVLQNRRVDLRPILDGPVDEGQHHDILVTVPIPTFALVPVGLDKFEGAVRKTASHHPSVHVVHVVNEVGTGVDPSFADATDASQTFLSCADRTRLAHEIENCVVWPIRPRDARRNVRRIRELELEHHDVLATDTDLRKITKWHDSIGNWRRLRGRNCGCGNDTAVGCRNHGDLLCNLV